MSSQAGSQASKTLLQGTECLVKKRERDGKTLLEGTPKKKRKERHRKVEDQRSLNERVKISFKSDEKKIVHHLSIITPREVKEWEEQSIILNKPKRETKSPFRLSWGEVKFGSKLPKGKNDTYYLYTKTLPRAAILILTPLQNLLHDPLLHCTIETNTFDEQETHLLLACFVVKSDPPKLVDIVDPKATMDMLQDYKSNLIKPLSNSHFGSRGTYFSFGISASFKPIRENPSMMSTAEYAWKKRPDEELQTKIENDLKRLITQGIKRIESIFPAMSQAMAVPCKIACQLSKELGTSTIETMDEKIPFMSTSICFDAYTEIFHTEKDCTYTLISTPSQERKNLARNLQFKFLLNEKILLNIPLLEQSTLLFSAYFLSHRQQCDSDTSLPSCINLASYSNYRTFTNLRQSFRRNGQQQQQEQEGE